MKIKTRKAFGGGGQKKTIPGLRKLEVLPTEQCVNISLALMFFTYFKYYRYNYYVNFIVI